MRTAIPSPRPANNPFVIEGFLSERNTKRRKNEVKNKELVCDIIVEDISRNQIDTAPKAAAKIPTLELNISLPRK